MTSSLGSNRESRPAISLPHLCHHYCLALLPSKQPSTPVSPLLPCPLTIYTTFHTCVTTTALPSYHLHNLPHLCHHYCLALLPSTQPSTPVSPPLPCPLTIYTTFHTCVTTTALPSYHLHNLPHLCHHHCLALLPSKQPSTPVSPPLPCPLTIYTTFHTCVTTTALPSYHLHNLPHLCHHHCLALLPSTQPSTPVSPSLPCPLTIYNPTPTQLESLTRSLTSSLVVCTSH
ncbi:hypothetical protein OTU49_008687 [Cherax quadricarinatus]|uniref:Uncharacterized protein n=1 Tax=Cherax quadricarinatus TaxID=27406 RepID=A0AAW0WTT1_CHEQU